MKKLTFIIIICLACTSIQTKGDEIFKIKTSKTIDQNETWITSVGVSKSGRRVKVKYQLDFMGNVCTICGGYVWGGYNWESAFINKDDNGYYVSYFGENYYF
jgi:hypothetical protein